MKKKQFVFVAAMLLLSLALLGGWTSIPQNSEAEEHYAGGMPRAKFAQDVISYTSKNIVENVSTAGDAPKYITPESMQNGCGPVAGGIIVGFYDKYYENLIPGWQSYYPASGKYRIADKAYVPALLGDLYTRMHTNQTGAGVTENEFKDGLQSYVQSTGYSLNYQSVATSTSLDYNACKTAIKNNKVIALFIRAGDIYTVLPQSGADVVTSITMPSSHIMVAYGYMQLEYYNNSGLFRTDTYLILSTGLSGMQIAYYRVNQHNLNAAYVINVA